MKLAASTLGCPDWTFPQILENFSRIGLQGIEIRGIDGQLEASEISWFSPKKEAETKSLLRQSGLRFIGFGSSCHFHEKTTLRQNIQKAKDTIDILERMNIPALRVFGNNIPDPTQKSQTIHQVAEAVCEVAEYGQRHAVHVNLEVHGDFNTVETLEPIVNAFQQTPAAGILWDIEHSDKTYGDNFLDFYRLIQPLLRHIHIKDYLRKKPESAKSWPIRKVGDGDIPIPQILRQVVADGYDGFFSLEWEKRWHPEIEEPEVVFPHFVKKMYEWFL
ncbi:MAG: sugar phosphate isomerase/epimerase [Victivallales bacterium]|nr:sugar phosphate isomerase/epimerase [Victivallales bacterium]